MVTLAALLNANSSNYTFGLLQRISREIKEINGGGEEWVCRATYDENSIKREVKEIAEMEPRNLVLASGDGGLGKYILEIDRIYQGRETPKIVYLPIGRENRLGYELGIKKKPEKFFEEAVGGIKRGQLEYEKMSLIRAKLDGEKNLLTFDLGWGLATNLLLHYYGMEAWLVKKRKDDEFRNRSYPRKRIDSFKTFAGAVLNSFRYWTEAGKKFFGGTVVEIKTEKENLGRGYWLGGLAATNRHVWKGFKPMYRGREDPEKMHLIVTDRSPLRLVSKLWTLYKGGPIGGNTIDELVGRMELNFDEPTIIQMAGEFFVAEHVEMEVEKERLCFVKPRKER